MARFLKTLDSELAEKRNDVEIVAVWLTDEVEKGKEYLPRAQQSIKLQQTALTVFEGEKNGPDGWGVNTDAYVTAVAVEKGKVTESFAFISVNETDVPKVFAALKEKE